MKPLCFVTGNKHKVEEFNNIVSQYNLNITNMKLDVPEVQGTAEEVSKKKCLAAAQLYDGPVIIEDVSFCVEAWNGLPGAYIKTFLESVGPDGIVNMLSTYENKAAYAQCIYSYSSGKGAEVQQFIGRCYGKIVPNSGKSHFGSISFDGIFAPNDYNGQTFGDLPIEIKNKISHRAEAIKKLTEFLKTLKQ